MCDNIDFKIEKHDDKYYVHVIDTDPISGEITSSTTVVDEYLLIEFSKKLYLVRIIGLILLALSIVITICILFTDLMNNILFVGIYALSFSFILFVSICMIFAGKPKEKGGYITWYNKWIYNYYILADKKYLLTYEKYQYYL